MYEGAGGIGDREMGWWAVAAACRERCGRLRGVGVQVVCGRLRPRQYIILNHSVHPPVKNTRSSLLSGRRPS